MIPLPASRTSHERAAVEALQEVIGDRPDASIYFGYRPDNRLDVVGWHLTPGQYIQFGDLRYETPRIRVVIEVESGGGVGNLVKYWPLLATQLTEKPFFLLHLYRLASKNDYVAHRKLWKFLRARMREELEARGRAWRSDWYASIGTYRSVDDLQAHAASIASVLDDGLRAARSEEGG
jgi:hypothetical protein